MNISPVLYTCPEVYISFLKSMHLYLFLFILLLHFFLRNYYLWSNFWLSPSFFSSGVINIHSIDARNVKSSSDYWFLFKSWITLSESFNSLIDFWSILKFCIREILHLAVLCLFVKGGLVKGLCFTPFQCILLVSAYFSLFIFLFMIPLGLLDLEEEFNSINLNFLMFFTF